MEDLLQFFTTLLFAIFGGFVIGRLSNRSQSSEAKKNPQSLTIFESRLPRTLSERLFPIAKGTDETIEVPESRRQIFIVCFELPIKAKKVDGAWLVEWDPVSTVISTMREFMKEMDVTFVGHPGVFVPRDEYDHFEEIVEAFNCVPVFLDPMLHNRFFAGFCKRVLLRMLHYQMPFSDDEFLLSCDELWQAYTTVNMLYSRKVTLLVENETDTIWVHDYHLLLVPSFIRKKLPKAKIGLFVHTPFPTSDVFRCLPGRISILRGFLSADLVGFHTYDYARHFLSTCKRVLDLDFETLPGGTLGVTYLGRSVSIRISHIGIPLKSVCGILASEPVNIGVELIKKRHAGRRLVLGVDKLDSIHCILIKLLAYERFLSIRSEWSPEVAFVEILVTTSDCTKDSDLIVHAVREKVLSIQKKHGERVIEVIQVPLEDNTTIFAHYKAADVAFLSSFWDGPCVIPFEYTVAQTEADPGVLIISEFMGCSRSLNGVIRVNPWNLERVGEAMNTALLMSVSERKALHMRRQRYVEANDFEHWVRGYLRDLDEAAAASCELNYVQVGWGSNVRLIGLRADFRHLEEAEIVASYRHYKRRLLLFDYDGTLSSKIGEKPSESTMHLLQTLSEDPSNVVFILSGRTRELLFDWFGSLPKLGIAAEKGVYMRWPDNLAWEAMPNLGDFSWKETAYDLMKAYADRTDGCYIEKKESALVWHYQNADPEFGKMQGSELVKYLQRMLEPTHAVDVVRYDYDRILEVKPRGVSKGVAARRIVSRLKSETGLPQFLLSIGDDRSDEDTFQALTSGYAKSSGKIYTCCVGLKPSNAHYYLQDTHEVLKLLNGLSLVSAQALRTRQRLGNAATS